MKTISKNLLAFSVCLVVLTIAFRFSLSTMLEHQLFGSIWMIAAIYGVLIFVIGWIFGRKEKKDLPLYDIGFRFHLATYLVCNLVAEAWHFFGLQSEYENVKSAHYMVIYWGIGLLFHFVMFLITRKNAIKGIKKSEIFE